MSTLTLVAGCVFIGTCLTTDAKGTVMLVTAVITIRGVVFIFKHIAGSLNKTYGEFIDFTGWSLAGVPIIGLIKLAKQGLEPVFGTVSNIYNIFNSIATHVESGANWIENLIK